MTNLRLALFAALLGLSVGCGSRMDRPPEMGRSDLGGVRPVEEDPVALPPTPGVIVADPVAPVPQPAALNPPVRNIDAPAAPVPAKPPAKKKKKK